MPRKKYSMQKDGRYFAKVWDGSYTKDGRKHLKTITSSKSSKDLENKVALFKKSLEEGLIVADHDVTLLEYAMQWQKIYKANAELNTKSMYERIIRGYFPFLGDILLCDVKRMHFQALINQNADHPRTCQQIQLTFKQVIRSAISDKLLPASALMDICDGISIPKYSPKEKRGLTTREVSAIRTAPFSPMERAFVYLAYYCGLRRGEILALTVFDIDLKGCILAINKAVAFDGNNSVTKGTKSANGNRSVPIPHPLSEFLKGYIPTLKTSYLFTTQKGGPLTRSGYSKLWKRIFNKINEELGGSPHIKMTDISAHVFRHNYCSNLCYQIPAVSIKKIARLLGDSEKMVIEVYNHILDEKEDVATAISNMFSM